MNTDELNRVLYALSCIGDHSEAISAYQALAMLYPQHHKAIRAAFERDQCDWWAADTIIDCFSANHAPTIERRYAQWLDAQKGKPL